MNKIVHYKHWKTGEEREYKLNSDNSYSEQLTKVFCPFDKTPIIFKYNDYFQTCFCPNCSLEYSKNSNQEEINKQAESQVREWQKNLVSLHKQTATLELRIKHAEKQGLLQN